MKPTKNISEFKHLYLCLSISWTILVVTLSLVSFSGISVKVVQSFKYTDKVVHFVFYFVMTLLLMRFFYRETAWFKRFYSGAICAFLVVFSIGLVVEYLQKYLTISRRFDMQDVYFNSFGIVIALLFMKLKKSKKL